MRPRFTCILAVFTVAAALVAPAYLAAADGPFQKLKFAEACARARTDGKLVFVDVWASWCGPCKMLDSSTWKDPTVVELLTSRAVAIKINADVDVAFVNAHQIEALPTLLVFRPDGSEVARVVGYVDAEKFRAELGAALDPPK